MMKKVYIIKNEKKSQLFFVYMLWFLLKWLLTDQLELRKSKNTHSIFNIFNAVTLFIQQKVIN